MPALPNGYQAAYRLNWETGERNPLIVSIGTGAAESLGKTAAKPNRNIVSTEAGLPEGLMYSIQSDQDICCRTMGRCTYGATLDHETLDLVPRQVDEGMTIEERYNAPPIPLSRNLGRSFLYARRNADLSRRGLDHLGFGNLDPTSIQKMDVVENMSALTEISKAASSGHKGHF